MAAAIYTGFWINRSHDAIQGATLTLSPRNGAILTAAVATFVTIVTAQLWRLLMLFLHRLRVSNKPKDGLRHQQQVLIRNCSSPGSLLWLTANQAFYWRSQAEHAISRSLPWILLSFLYFIVASAAAVFSSEVSKAAETTRLLKADSCGLWELNNNNSAVEATQASADFTGRMLTRSAAYAKSCYHSNSSDPGCHLLPRQELAWSGSDSTCPFGDSICMQKSNLSSTPIEWLPFEMDSGAIDSHADLGINAPKNNRINFRKKTVCAPINSRGYITTSTGLKEYGSRDKRANDTMANFMFGPALGNKYTYQYDLQQTAFSVGYTMNAQTFIQAGSQATLDWQPIPTFQRNDADVLLIFINANRLSYLQPCDDPVFSAHVNTTMPSTGQPVYAPDYYASIIGCTEQYSICNGRTNSCTPLLGGLQIVNETSLQSLDLNQAQMATALRVGQAAAPSSYFFLHNHGIQMLKASDSVTGSVSTPLPADQWRSETAAWFDAGLAQMQFWISDYVNSGLMKGMVRQVPNDTYWQQACDSQITQETYGTISFSVLGLAIIAVMGSAIILLSILIEPLLALACKRFSIGQHPSECWALDDKLQLQRIACAANGCGKWSTDRETPIPTTLTSDTWVSSSFSKRASRLSGSTTVGFQAFGSANSYHDSEKDADPSATRVVYLTKHNSADVHTT